MTEGGLEVRKLRVMGKVRAGEGERMKMGEHEKHFVSQFFLKQEVRCVLLDAATNRRGVAQAMGNNGFHSAVVLLWLCI